MTFNGQGICVCGHEHYGHQQCPKCGCNLDPRDMGVNWPQ